MPELPNKIMYKEGIGTAGVIKIEMDPKRIGLAR